MKHQEAAASAPRTTPQFFIPFTASLQERRPRTLKHGDTFAVFDHNGDALAGPGSPEGIYHRDTRHLSHLYLTVDGAPPAAAELDRPRRQRRPGLRPDQPGDRRPRRHPARSQDLLHIRRTRFLWNARAFERLRGLATTTPYRAAVRMRIDFAADFADIFEVRGSERPRRGACTRPRSATDAVTLAYTGLDDGCARPACSSSPHRPR